MFNFDNFLFFILPVVGIGLVTLIVWQSNQRSKTNIYFTLMSLSVILWLTLIYLADASLDSDLALQFVRFAIAASKLIAVTFLLFCLHFPSQTTVRASNWVLYVPALIFAVFALSPYMVKTVSLEQDGASITSVSLLYSLDTLIILIYFVGGAFLLLSQRHRVNKVERRQINLILLGIFAALAANLFTNYLYPLIADKNSINIYGGLSLLIFVSITAYAIVKHKLFDVKPIVARSIGYILSLSLLIALFSLTSAFVVGSLLENRLSPGLQTAINAAVFAAAVLTYPGLKRYFDRITNKYFFRDAYDPQEFLDQLNKSIVSNIEIGILLRHTTAIIEENLKSSFVQIVVPKTESTAERIAGTKEVKYSDHEINYMRGRLVGLGKKLVTEEDLDPEEDELEKILTKHDISLLVHLSATSYGQDQTIAFMIFGNKKSGNVYSKADLKIIEIIADELVIAIQNALRFEEIQEFNVTLQNKVNTATNKLRRTNEKLKTLDETKDEFISMASHQLRTPLTSVKGYLSMVLEGDAGNVNPEQRKLLDQAFVSSQRMVYLIADLLNVSRLRTGKFVIDAHPSNLADLVEGEVFQLKEQAKSKNLTLVYEKPDDFPGLMLDETKTRQVVMNFVDNALYYTPAGGKINVSVTSDKNHVYFMVKDNGLGVPKEEQKHLFTKFYRAKNARNIRPDGTGLGLFMAKKVVTAQGGNILFESIEGKGSTFGFSFNKKHLAIPEAIPVLEEKTSSS